MSLFIKEVVKYAEKLDKALDKLTNPKGKYVLLRYGHLIVRFKTKKEAELYGYHVYHGGCYIREQMPEDSFYLKEAE